MAGSNLLNRPSGMKCMEQGEAQTLTTHGLQMLLDALMERGYRVLGPAIRDGAIVYDDIAHLNDLPKGWTDEQDGGRYRLKRREDEAYFGYAVGPTSWKKFLHPPVLHLFTAHRAEGAVGIRTESQPTERYAFIGVRACELNAIAIQDRVFLGGAHPEPNYQARREVNFIVAINCGTAGGTCFCVSMEAGPKAKRGYDLPLTELFDDDEHRFLVEAGSEAGAAVLEELPARAPQRQKT